jgi:hypothetical protein
MPDSRPRALRDILTTAVVAALFLGAAPALASACVSGPESHPFAAYGDDASYVMAPSGSFEPGATGWALTDAAVVSDEEGTNLTGHQRSLVINAGGSAVSPLVCVSSKYPSFRFFARQLSGPKGASLNVSVQWLNVLGLPVSSSAGAVLDGGSWGPSPVLMTDESLPLVGGLLGILTLEVKLVFRPSGGSFAIDDVYVDPRMSH